MCALWVGVMPKKFSSKITGISYIVIAFLCGYQLRATYDFDTNVNFVTETNVGHGILNPSMQYQSPSQIIHPTKASRPKFSNKNQSICERQWDWPFLDEWEQNTYATTDQKITTFHVPRSNAHETAQGTIQMQVIQRSNPKNANTNKNTRVVIFVSHRDTMGANAWHRIAVQYMVWMAWQVAEHRLSDIWSTITNVELAMPCTHLTDIPQGWNDLLFATRNNNYGRGNDRVTLVDTTKWCTNEFLPRFTDELVEELQPLFDEKYGNSSSSIDVILVPPNDGLLWDLAWDTSFECKESHMFRTFMSQFTPWQNLNANSIIDASSQSKVCWILRYGNPQRDIQNREEVHGMLLSIFDTVRLIHATRYHTSVHIKNTMEDCQVAYGVHGAGMVNAMWGTMSTVAKTAVVEVLPKNQPQYFRSLSALVGHYYEGVLSDHRMEAAQYYIDLEKSADALRRARDYVTEISRY